MKRLLLSFGVMIASLSLFAQNQNFNLPEEETQRVSEPFRGGVDDWNNFRIINEKTVIWQNVYQTNLSFDELRGHLMGRPCFSDIVIGNNVITCRINRTSVDYTEAGFGNMDIPIYVAQHHFTGFATIQYKEGRYRVTVENITLLEETTDPGRGLVDGRPHTVETWALKGVLKKQPIFSNHFIETASVVYNVFLLNLFDTTQKSFLDNEW